MSEAIKPIGQTTEAQQVAAQQLMQQKQLRKAEQQTFNPNATGHTNPSIRDPRGVVDSLNPKYGPAGSFNEVSNPNTTPSGNIAMQMPAAVISLNLSGSRSPLGSKVNFGA